MLLWDVSLHTTRSSLTIRSSLDDLLAAYLLSVMKQASSSSVSLTLVMMILLRLWLVITSMGLSIIVIVDVFYLRIILLVIAGILLLLLSVRNFDWPCPVKELVSTSWITARQLILTWASRLSFVWLAKYSHSTGVRATVASKLHLIVLTSCVTYGRGKHFIVEEGHIVIVWRVIICSNIWRVVVVRWLLALRVVTWCVSIVMSAKHRIVKGSWPTT